jgi:hypothetical protein
LQNTVWGQTYFTVTSSSLALNGTIMVLHANNLSGYNLAAFSVYLKKDTSGYHFEMSYINSTPGTSYIACSNGTASLNQWYRVGVYYSNSSANTEAKLFVDGTQCGSTGTDVGSRQARYFLLGSGLILPQGFSAEWDNLTIDNDNDATPGACL